MISFINLTRVDFFSFEIQSHLIKNRNLFYFSSNHIVLTFKLRYDVDHLIRDIFEISRDFSLLLLFYLPLCISLLFALISLLFLQTCYLLSHKLKNLSLYNLSSEFTLILAPMKYQRCPSSSCCFIAF